jgi:hypothetical protein
MDVRHFDNLVSILSLDERQKLLEKMKRQSGLSGDPLYAEEKVLLNTDSEFSVLPWHKRLLYRVLSLLKSKDPVKIFKEYQVLDMGSKIEGRTPGLYDCQNDMLLPVFFRQLQKLKDAAQFFYSALDAGVNRDKGAFFAFLGSLEMPHIHKLLQEETAPALFVGRHPEKSEKELRQMAFKTMEDALAMIPDDIHDTMYYDARSLNCLMELSSFPYDRVLMGFDGNSANGKACSVNVVKDLLASLNDKLFSLKVIPPMALLESLFVFSLQARVEESGFDINREIRPILAKAGEALTVIREFNKQVPLALILRCSTGDMALSPKEASGGEGWFVVYRDYWKRRIESIFTEYMKNHRQNELVNSFRHFLKDKSPKSLENIQSNSNPEGMPIKGAFALSFLYTFYSVVFMPDFNWILQPILINGEFQKKENHTEFAESYNNLIKLEDEIIKFENKISLTGDYGRRYGQIKRDVSSPAVKRHKVQMILEEAQKDAQRILEGARDASASMINILGGILQKGANGKYGALLNLSTVAGRGEKFIKGMGGIIKQFQTVLKILDDIEKMEIGK